MTPYNSTNTPVSYTHLRAHETDSYLVCRLLLEKKLTHQLTEIVSQLGIADALFSAGETRAKKSVCSRRLGHSLGRHI